MSPQDWVSLRFLRPADSVTERCCNPGCCGYNRIEGCSNVEDSDCSRSNYLPGSYAESDRGRLELKAAVDTGSYS